MKIAIFHEISQFSGARKAVKEYGRYLGNSNTVDIYYVDEKRDIDIQRIFSNVYFFRFQSRRWVGNNWKAKLYKDTVELLRLYILHKKIGELINKGHYDLVFIHPSKYTQTPFILRFIFQKTVYYCPEPLRMAYENVFAINKDLIFYKKIYEKIIRMIKQYLDKSNFNKADLIIVNSIFTKQNVKQIYGRDSYICYPGVDKYIYKNLNIKKIYDVLFIGPKELVEGYDLLEKLKLMFKIKNISARDSGKGLSEIDLGRQYNKSKIVVCLAVNEPFGLVPLEAMACGVPVIAVDEGGYKETVIDNKTGFLIERDSKLLSDKIKFLLDNPDLAKEMGKNGREEILKKWTWEKRGKELEEILLKAYEDFDNNS